MFRSMIHFELILVQGVNLVHSPYFCLCVANGFGTFVKNQLSTRVWVCF